MVDGSHLIPADDAWDLERAEQRRSLLTSLLIVFALAGWVFFCATVFAGWGLGRNCLAPLALLCAIPFAQRLKSRNVAAASWVLLLGLTLFGSLALIVYPSYFVAAAGALVIVAANVLLGSAGAAVLTLAVSGANAALLRYGTAGGLLFPSTLLELLLLYGCTLGMSWLTSQPMQRSLAMSMAAWRQATRAAAEARQRRGELYRALRALEEATARIEHMNEDLSLRRREAEEARAQRSRFVATVSHELRGPMNLILGFSKLIALSPEAYGEPLPKAYRADVDAIYRNSQHLAALVDDILDLSQIEAERLPLVKGRISLKEVIQGAANVVQPLAERKGLYLNLDLADNLPAVLADEVRLRQVLVNLLSNAIRLTERGGVLVRSRQESGEIVVSVQDTGPGIDEADIPRLFEEFRPLGSAPTRENRGSGLGLSISRRLIEMHGGRMWAESKKGTGSTFYFSLPLPDTAATWNRNLLTSAVPERDLPEVCLVVHDDPMLIRLLARYLEGYRIMGVPDEQEVIALTEQLHPRAIIADAASATRLTQIMEAQPFAVPVLSCPLPRLVDQVRLPGVVGYLVKPISGDAIAALMRRLERADETTVLLVDDDPDALRLLERLLTSLPRPYRILKAYDGSQALDLMRNVTPDVVFMDLAMPGMDGTALIAEMRRAERTRCLPVVIVSARDWEEDALHLGFPITIWGYRPLPMAQGMRCLQAILDALQPDYLPAATDPEPSATATPDPPAFAAQLPHPGPAPTGVG